MLRKAWILIAVTGACADDPIYYAPAAPVLEVNAGGGAADAMVTIPLPIRAETAQELADRTERATSMGLTAADVPYVKLDDMSLSVEWTLRNLDDAEGIARVDMNGANEWWRFVPELFDLDVEDEEVQPPPPLVDGAPLEIGPLETRSGVMREDQIVEAAIDLELMGRAGIAPPNVLLDVNEDTQEFTDMASGAMIPRELFAGFVELEVRFSATTHMVLEFAVRIRDHRGLMHDELGAGPPEEMQPFMPVDLAPPAPP
jgi:hypothetical protein